MTKHWFVALALAFPLCAAAPSLHARDASDYWDEFNHLKDDPDAYVGEGKAPLAEFHGDVDKALEAATLRARADLADAIRVHISSSTSESLHSDGRAVAEDISSSASSSSDLNLENVKIREFRDFPAAGKETVLAYVTKEDYRRQLAGKGVAVYAPQTAFRIGVDGMIVPAALDKPGKFQFAWGARIDRVQGPWVFGINLYDASLDVPVSSADAYDFGSNDGPGSGSAELMLAEGHIGYAWLPWRTRRQVYVPINLEFGATFVKPYMTYNEAVSTGLGYRFWFTDEVAFDYSVLWHQGLDPGTLKDGHGVAMLNATGQDINAPLTGFTECLAIVFSGF